MAGIFLRATNEAVNRLVGALEIDVEDAQIAADLRLESLIRKGRLSDAQAAAQTARYRTIQYGEQLRRRLEQTSRDVRTVDWLEEMPTFLACQPRPYKVTTRADAAAAGAPPEGRGHRSQGGRRDGHRSLSTYADR